MASIWQSNRAHKPRVYWNPTITSLHQTCRTQAPAFTIYTEFKDLNIQLSEQLSTQLYEDLIKDLDFKHAEALDFKSNEDLDSKLNEDLDTEPDEDLDTKPDENLDIKPDENQSYQSQFLSKNKVDKFQNLSEDSDSLKLFQLFFSVKEIENIVKQTNQWAVYMNFKHFWKSLTVIKIYHYLRCLVYMRVQSLQELNDHWQLKTSIASCFSKREFWQIQHAFTIWDSNTSSEQSKNFW